jgi:hypothetical protein
VKIGGWQDWLSNKNHKAIALEMHQVDTVESLTLDR